VRQAVAIIGGLIFGLFLGYLIVDFNGPDQEIINGLGVELGVGLMVAAAIRPRRPAE
jgi:hypothetical protein